MNRSLRLGLVASLVMGLVATACGSGASSRDTASQSTPDAGFPVTVEPDNGVISIDSRPQRIISLSPSATEMLFAVGAGEAVVAVDEHSYHPPEAPVTDLSGFQPNLEAITAFEPDLVVVSGGPPDVIEGLELLGIRVLVLGAPADIDGVYQQIELLGRATGNAGDASELVASLRSEVEEIVASLPAHASGLRYFHELDETLYTVTSSTFIGQVYGLLGLSSIADAADADGQAGGYPQLTAEYVIDADPDLIFLADAQCCGQSYETVARRPGWGGMRAVMDGRVIELDADVASRWGPRIVEHLRLVADAVAALVPAG